MNDDKLTEEEIDSLLANMPTLPITSKADAPKQPRIPRSNSHAGKNLNRLLYRAIMAVPRGQFVTVDTLMNIASSQDDQITRMELIERATYATRRMRQLCCDDCKELPAEEVPIICQHFSGELFLSITESDKGGPVIGYSHIDPETVEGRKITAAHIAQREEQAAAVAYHARIIKQISEDLNR